MWFKSFVSRTRNFLGEEEVYLGKKRLKGTKIKIKSFYRKKFFPNTLIEERMGSKQLLTRYNIIEANEFNIFITESDHLFTLKVFKKKNNSSQKIIDLSIDPNSMLNKKRFYGIIEHLLREVGILE